MSERIQGARRRPARSGKGGLMQDRLSQAVHGTPGGGSRDTKPDASSNDTPARTDVLGILEDIESQFNRLRTIRGEQVDSLRELAERSARLESQKTQLEAERTTLEKEQTDWNARINRARVELDDSKRCLEADRRLHERRLEEDKATLNRDRSSLQQDRERIQQEQETQRVAMTTLQAELAEKAESIAREEADIKSEQVQLEAGREARRREVDELISALLMARKLLEKRGRQVRHQEKKLDDYRSGARRSRSRRRSLESCTRAQRKKIRTLQEERDSQRDRLEEAGRRLRVFMEQLREQGDLVERGNAALALVDSLEGQIETLQSSLEKARNEVDENQLNRLKEIEEERDCLRGQIESKEATCRELEQRLQDEPDGETTAEVADQTRRLADIACHLHRRRERLRFLRNGMASRQPMAVDSGSHEARSRQLRQSEVIEQRQLELDEVRKMLANSERKMIQKWAAPRAVVISCWVLFAVSILATASWMAADRITPALRSTSITISPRIEQNETMTEQAFADWQAMHESQIKSEGFIRDVAQRSAARRLDPWNSYESVRRVVTDNLTVDTGQPGQIALTLANKEPGKAADFLEIMASSMVVDAQRSLASRPGGHASQIMDGRKEDGLIRHARLNPAIIKDERMVTAGVVMAGGLVVVAMMLCLVYTRLLRAKRIFEQEHSDNMDTASIRPI